MEHEWEGEVYQHGISTPSASFLAQLWNSELHSQVAISQTPARRPGLEPLLRHFGQIRITRRALERIEKVRKHASKHQYRTELDICKVEAANNGDEGYAETSAAEAYHGHAAPTEFVD